MGIRNRRWCLTYKHRTAISAFSTEKKQTGSGCITGYYMSIWMSIGDPAMAPTCCRSRPDYSSDLRRRPAWAWPWSCTAGGVPLVWIRFPVWTWTGPWFHRGHLRCWRGSSWGCRAGLVRSACWGRRSWLRPSTWDRSIRLWCSPGPFWSPPP